MNQITESKKINEADIKKIASKKIYFGHMSVGYNIIDGLKAIVPVDSGLNIMETSDPKDFSKPVFAHSKNGENTKPETKISAFIQKMDAGLGNKVDIAFFKFCYVDVTAGTDVNKLFNEYKAAMDGLIKKYPETIFLHVTVPVTTENKTIIKKIKDIIKQIIRKPISSPIADNIARMKFNILLKKTYGVKTLDLAKAESTDIFDKEALSAKGGIMHHAMRLYYSDDGGHLNSISKKFIAISFIKTLNELTQ